MPVGCSSGSNTGCSAGGGRVVVAVVVALVVRVVVMSLPKAIIHCSHKYRRPLTLGLADAIHHTLICSRNPLPTAPQAGLTLGTPIALFIPNGDQRPSDYATDVYRPSHADYTYHVKYGIKSASGGGRASARETAARVAAGAVAEKYLLERYGTEIVAWVSGIGKRVCVCVCGSCGSSRSSGTSSIGACAESLFGTLRDRDRNVGQWCK